MSETTCIPRRDCDCTLVSLIASVIIGIVTAFLRITAVITIPPVFFWVIFGISVGFLAITLVAVTSTRNTDNCDCKEKALGTQLVSLLATILLSLILLAITFVATSVVGAILTGLALLFFSLSLGSTACLIKCYAKCR